MNEHIGGINSTLDAVEPTQQDGPVNPLPTAITDERARRFGMMVADWQEGGVKREEVEQRLQLGRFIKTVRLAHNTTLADLAEQADLNAELVYYLEGGLASPGEIEAARDKLLEALGVSPAAFQHTLAKLNQATKAQ